MEEELNEAIKYIDYEKQKLDCTSTHSRDDKRAKGKENISKTDNTHPNGKIKQNPKKNCEVKSLKDGKYRKWRLDNAEKWSLVRAFHRINEDGTETSTCPGCDNEMPRCLWKKHRSSCDAISRNLICFRCPKVVIKMICKASYDHIICCH